MAHKKHSTHWKRDFAISGQQQAAAAFARENATNETINYDTSDNGIDTVVNNVRYFAQSGFGKGLLVTAGIVVAGAAILFGYGASLGSITMQTGSNVAVASVDQGVTIGVSQALKFLTDGWGLITLAAGGALGSLAKMKSEETGVSEPQGPEPANVKERDISRGQQPDISQEQEYARDTKSENYWAGYDSERRKASCENKELYIG